MAKIKLAEGEQEMIVFKGSTRHSFPLSAWKNLSPRRKAQFDVAGKKGVIGNAKIPVEQHSVTAQTAKIEIKEVKVEPIVDEPIEKVPSIELGDVEEIKDEVIELKPIVKEIPKITDRAELKAYFAKNPTKGYYVKMPTKKMIELYDSQK